jgi:hypothetical protein
MNLVSLYRCHFLDSRDHIEAHEEIEAGTLLEAIDRANAMLKERPQHDAVEVWAGNRGSTARRGEELAPRMRGPTEGLGGRWQLAGLAA